MSVNSKCPCGSGLKYKKCCKTYHDGKVAKNAMILMATRYCAYAVGDYSYILKTTHKSTRDSDTQSIKEFSKQTIFQNLEVLEFIDGKKEAYVTFKASLLQNKKDISFSEKSKFAKSDGRWYYVDEKVSQ